MNTVDLETIKTYRVGISCDDVDVHALTIVFDSLNDIKGGLKHTKVRKLDGHGKSYGFEIEPIEYWREGAVFFYPLKADRDKAVTEFNKALAKARAQVDEALGQ